MFEDGHPVLLRCSLLVIRDQTVLVCQRTDDWVLPGGTPRRGESAGGCAQRETWEETGLLATPARVAFVLEASNIETDQHLVEIIFLGNESRSYSQPHQTETGLFPQFVALERLAGLRLRPPIAGHIRSLHGSGSAPTAAYLGNLWRSTGETSGYSPVFPS